MIETNEATPAARGITMATGDDSNEDELMGEGHVTSHVTSLGHVTSQSDRDNDEVQIIDIASDSEGKNIEFYCDQSVMQTDYLRYLS